MNATSRFLCRQIRFSTYHSSGNRTSSRRTRPERTAACNWLTWNRKRSYLSVAAFLPVEHGHRLPAFIGHHDVDQGSRHIGLPPFELSDAL